MTDYRQPPTQEDLEIIYDLPDEELVWCAYCNKYVDITENHNHEGDEDERTRE